MRTAVVAIIGLFIAMLGASAISDTRAPWLNFLFIPGVSVVITYAMLGSAYRDAEK